MQRIILRQLKASVHRLQGVPPPEIAKYYQAYKREFKRYEKISNKSELLRAVKKADIVFGADFHPFAQSQRTHLRILRDLVKSRRVVLALEAIDSNHQQFLDQYQRGELDDKTFLKKINYSHSWGFPWENYKVLFDFAREHKVRIVGINRSHYDQKHGDLELRDAHSARMIAGLRKKNPEELVYVIYGDLHLASPHLPRLTRRNLAKDDDARFVTIFQNSESLYWRLAQRKLEERVDVLKLKPDVFCVVNSPPWLKWQAYLNFLEQTIENEESEGRDLADETDHLSDFVRPLKTLLNVDGNFEDFHVYSRGDGKLASHLNRSLSKKDFARVMAVIRLGKNIFIPEPPTFYLASSGVNHAAGLAGQYIHSKMRREKSIHFDFPKDFIAQIWIEAVGFFASKLINPRRKFNTINDLPSRHQVTLLVLEQRLRDQVALNTRKPIKTARRHRNRKTQDYLEGARTIGALLGNKMYKAFRCGQLDIPTLHRWLKTKVDSSPAFGAFYVGVLSSLKNIPAGERSKNERL